jgi:hypothetical protein
MKGLALALQFNPHSPLTDADFSTLNTLMGDRPVLAAAAPAAIDQYKQDLLTARGLLQTAYAFDAANMGSNDGTGGW